jgi:hypothetical protein
VKIIKFTLYSLGINVAYNVIKPMNECSVDTSVGGGAPTIAVTLSQVGCSRPCRSREQGK